MKTYLERFNAMVDEIKSHPLLEVKKYVYNPPVSKEVFNIVEQMIGSTMAIPIQNFYNQVNGLTVEWGIKKTISEEELDASIKKYNDYEILWPEEQLEPFAKINILPIEDTFINVRWEEDLEFLTEENSTFEFAGETYFNNEFAKLIKPFDMFSDYYTMAFLLEKGNGNPKMFLLQDYYANWYHSRITDFKSYIEMLFVTRGIVEARERFYSEPRGDLMPLLIMNSRYWTKEHTPKLFKNHH